MIIIAYQEAQRIQRDRCGINTEVWLSAQVQVVIWTIDLWSHRHQRHFLSRSVLMTSHIIGVWRPLRRHRKAAAASCLFPEGRWASSGAHPHGVLGSRSDPSQSLHYAASSGYLTVVRLREGPKFKSPWAKQVLSTLTSPLAAKQSYWILSSHPNSPGPLSPLRHAQEYICQPK